MKLNKKLLALGLALLMVAAMALTAVAASTDTTSSTNPAIRGASKFITNMKGHFMGQGGKFGALGQSLGAVSKLTGLTVAEIQTELQAGKTLAAIAATKNVTQDALIAAITTDMKQKLDTAKTDGKITQEQYDKCISDLASRITKEVTEVRPTEGRGGKFGAPGQSLDAVSKLTGLTVAEIQTELQAGKTLAAIAATKNVTQDALIAAITTDMKQNLDTAKTDGKITQEQYDKCISDLASRVTEEVTEVHPGNREGKGGKFGAPGQSLDVVSKLTSLTVAEIKTELQAGKTLAAIAATKNVTQDALIAALTADMKQNLDTAKTDGKITQAQYDKMTSDLTSRITKQVTSTSPTPGEGGKGGPGMRGHGRGMERGQGSGSSPRTAN